MRLAAAILLPGLLSGPAASAEELAFVLAKPLATRQVMPAADQPENAGSQDRTLGHVVRTRLSILRVIHGQVPEAEIVVQLIVDNEDKLRRSGELLVLLVRDAQGSYQSIGWDIPKGRLACLPAEMVTTDALGASLPIRVPDPPQRCAKF